jgi:hypothetical protein
MAFAMGRGSVICAKLPASWPVEPARYRIAADIGQTVTQASTLLTQSVAAKATRLH